MDLSISPAAAARLNELRAFMDERAIPAEPVYTGQRAQLAERGEPNGVPAVLDELIAEARERGLWNLFLRDVSGMSNVDYAVLAEETGRSPFIGPAAMNCLSPDTGNMELLHMFGTREQKRELARTIARRQHPLGLLDDRAGRRVERRPQHLHLDRARRGRIRR